MFIIIPLTWLLAISGAIGLLHREYSAIPERPKEIIANLDNGMGSILYKEENELIWYDLIEYRKVHNNVAISTGINSKAQITFKSGRTIQLGENTRITLTTSSQSNHHSQLILDLLNGTVVVNQEEEKLRKKGIKKHHIQKLSIKSGKDILKLDKPSSEIALTNKGSTKILYHNKIPSKSFKDLKIPEIPNMKKVSMFHKEFDHTFIPTASYEIEDEIFDKNKSQPLFLPDGKIISFYKQDIVEIPDPKNHKTRLIYPPPGSILWLFKSNRSEHSIPIILGPPPTKPKIGNWIPFIAMSSSKRENLEMVGKSIWKKQSISIPLSLPRQFSQKTIRFKIGTSISHPDDENLTERAYTGKGYLEVKNIDFLNQKPIRIDLNKIGRLRKDISLTTNIQTKMIPSQSIFLHDGHLVYQLKEYLDYSPDFTIEVQKWHSDKKAFHIIKDQKVIAQIYSKDNNSEFARQILSALHGNLIYQGKVDDYIGSLKSSNALRIAKTKDHIFVLENKKLIKLSRFVLLNSNINVLFNRSTPHSFKSKVSIVDTASDLQSH